MDMIIEAPVLSLRPGQVVTLDDAQGVRIRATGGSIWVTYEGNFNDLIIEPGRTLVIARNGRTVVQAMQPAHLALQ